MDRNKLTFESFMAAYFCAAQAYHYWRLRGKPVVHREHWGNSERRYPEPTKATHGGWLPCGNEGLPMFRYQRRWGFAALDSWRWSNPKPDRPRGTGPAQADSPPPPCDNVGGSPSGSLCGACGVWMMNEEEG